MLNRFEFSNWKHTYGESNWILVQIRTLTQSQFISFLDSNDSHTHTHR